MKHIVCVFVLFVAVVARAQAPAAMTLQVAQGDKVVSNGMAMVVNIDHIRVRATIPANIAQQSDLDSVRSVPVVELTVTSNADGRVVPSRHSITGFSVAPEGALIDMVLEIPIGAGERRAIVERLVDEVTRNASSPQVAEQLHLQRQYAIKWVDSLFVQHRTGDYTLCFQLRNPRMDGVSSIIPLRVVDAGTFADRMKEPPSAAKR